MTTKRKPGRPSLASSGRTSVYVHAPISEVAEWKRAAKRADMTLNGRTTVINRSQHPTETAPGRQSGDAMPERDPMEER